MNGDFVQAPMMLNRESEDCEMTEDSKAKGIEALVNKCPLAGCAENMIAEHRMCARHWRRVSVRTRELIHRARVNYWRECSPKNKKRLETIHGKAAAEATAEAELLG